MRTGIVIGLIILAGLVAGYFFYQARFSAVPEQHAVILPADYEKIAADIAKNINDISPTPPLSPHWQVESVEFVQGSDLAYVNYNDAHNVFRLLVQIASSGGTFRYRLAATFEPVPEGWKLTHGEDAGANKQLSKISINTINQ